MLKQVSKFLCLTLLLSPVVARGDEAPAAPSTPAKLEVTPPAAPQKLETSTVPASNSTAQPVTPPAPIEAGTKAPEKVEAKGEAPNIETPAAESFLSKAYGKLGGYVKSAATGTQNAAQYTADKLVIPVNKVLAYALGKEHAAVKKYNNLKAAAVATVIVAAAYVAYKKYYAQEEVKTPVKAPVRCSVNKCS